MRRRLEDLDYPAEADGWTDGEDWADPGPAAVLRAALHQSYAGADDEAYDDALEAVLDGMSAAEALNFEKALRQVERGAGQALASPLVGQVARTALPVGAGALGTVIGGPAGTAIGSQLGNLAAGALAPPGQPAKPAGAPAMVAGTPPGPPAPAGGSPVAAGPPPVAGAATPAVAGGSAAATQALIATQLGVVPRALLALALGQHGARQVDGVPVAKIMEMLSAIYGQAAADADELAYLDGERLDEGEFGEGRGGYAEPDLGTGRALYTTLMDVENEDLAS